MPIPKTIWTELWRRAQREELGLFLRFSDTQNARWWLAQTRPEEAKQYSIAVPDLNTILIVAPSVNLSEERDAKALRLIQGDLS